MFDSQIDLYHLLGVLWSRLWLVVLVLGATLALTYVVVSRVPRLYEASATILVEPRPNFYGQTQERQTVPDGSTVSSNVQLVRSPDTLRAVAETLGLDRQPEYNGGKSGTAALDAAVTALEDRSLVTSELGTAIIWLRARARTPEEARLLTQTIAETAISRRAQQGLDDARQALGWLEGTIPELRQRVAAAEDAVAKFRIAHGAVANVPEGSVVAGQLSDMAGRRLAAEQRSASLAARAAVLRRGSAGAALAASGELAADSSTRSLIETRANLQGQLAQQASRLSPNHPTIAGLRAQIAELDRQLATAARQVAEELERRAESERALAWALRADQQGLQQTVGGETRDSVALMALEQEAAAQRGVLEQYLLQVEAARAQVDSGAAFADMRLVSHPVVASAPVSPKTSLVLLAVAIVAGSLIVTWLIVTSLVASRSPVGCRRRGPQRV